MQKIIGVSLLGIVWAAVALGTAGCESLDEEQMTQLRRTVAAWLDPGEETAESASGD